MADSSTERPPETPSTVLVVEDDDGTREFLEVALSLTFTVDVARTAAEALAMVREQKTSYDVFLLDISLGSGTGGVAVLKALRDIDRYRTTPAIAITAYHPNAAPERFMEAGFDGYLRKPFYQQDLLDLIDKLLAPNAT